MDTQSIRRAYKRYAAIYDVVFGKPLQQGRLELIRMLQTRPGESLLEVGVGTGLLLPMYARDISIVGIDICPEILEVAAKRIRDEGLDNVSLHVMDAEHMTFPNGAFDHVVIAYVYSVTPNPAQLIREARRVCKPDGNIWLVNHFSDTGIWGWLERVAKPFARILGFRPDFPITAYVHDMDWNTVDVRSVNLFGLSRIIHFKNSERPAPYRAPAPGVIGKPQGESP